MRDALIVATVALLTLYALRQPWVGMLLWTCLSLGYPHEAFGYNAATMPLAAAAAAATLVGMLITRERRNPLDRPANWALLAFTAWLCVTLPFSVYFDSSLWLWQRSMKIFLMIFVTIALIDSERKLQAFIWVCSLSVAVYGVKGGLFTIATAGSGRVWGPGGFIEGNNELALALITVIPLLRYLQLQQTKRWVSAALLGAMMLSAVAVLGTHSRGALVGIAAMGFFLWLKSASKLKVAPLILIAGILMVSFMPDQWWQRMETIGTYQEDDSALGRLNAWQFAWNLARDNFFGGGFAIYQDALFLRYAPDPQRIHAAHSIYFQVLGEHGFVGLALFLLIGVLTWMEARGLVKAARGTPTLKWADDLGRMVQVSMVGFGTAGAFLSLAYYDLPYNIMAIAVCAAYLVRRALASTAPSLGTQNAMEQRVEAVRT